MNSTQTIAAIDPDFIEHFIHGMKAREQDERDLADEHLTRAAAIQGERMKLEQYLYKLKQASSSAAGASSK